MAKARQLPLAAITSSSISLARFRFSYFELMQRSIAILLTTRRFISMRFSISIRDWSHCVLYVVVSYGCCLILSTCWCSSLSSRLCFKYLLMVFLCDVYFHDGSKFILWDVLKTDVFAWTGRHTLEFTDWSK